MHPGKSRGEGKAELFVAKKLPGGQPDDGARAGASPATPRASLPPAGRGCGARLSRALRRDASRLSQLSPLRPLPHMMPIKRRQRRQPQPPRRQRGPASVSGSHSALVSPASPSPTRRPASPPLCNARLRGMLGVLPSP